MMDGGGWRGGPGCVAVNEGVHRAGSASGERGLRRADCEARSGRTQPHQLQTQVEQKLADAGQEPQGLPRATALPFHPQLPF